MSPIRAIGRYSFIYSYLNQEGQSVDLMATGNDGVAFSSPSQGSVGEKTIHVTNKTIFAQALSVGELVALRKFSITNPLF